MSSHPKHMEQKRGESQDDDLHAFLLKRLAEERLEHAEVVHGLKLELKECHGKLRDGASFTSGQAAIIHELQEKCNELAWLKADAEEAVVAAASGEYKGLQRSLEEARGYASAVASENTSLAAEVEGLRASYGAMQAALREAEGRAQAAEGRGEAEGQALRSALEEALQRAQAAESQGSAGQQSTVAALTAQVEALQWEGRALGERLAGCERAGEEARRALARDLEVAQSARESALAELTSAKEAARRYSSEAGTARAEVGAAQAEVVALKAALARLQTTSSSSSSSTSSTAPTPAAAGFLSPLPPSAYGGGGGARVGFTPATHPAPPPSAFKRMMMNPGEAASASAALHKTPGYKKARAASLAVRHRLGLSEASILAASQEASVQAAFASKAVAEVAQLKAALEACKGELAGLQVKYSESVAWAHQAEAHREALEGELVGFRRECERLGGERVEAQGEMERLRGEAQGECGRLQGEVEGARAAAQGLTQALEEARGEITRLELAVAHTREGLQAEFAQQWAAASEDMEGKWRAAKEEEVGAVTARVATLQGQVEALTLAVGMAEARVEEGRGREAGVRVDLAAALERVQGAAEEGERVGYERGVVEGEGRGASQLHALQSQLTARLEEESAHHTALLSQRTSDMEALVKEREAAVMGALERIAELEAHVAKAGAETQEAREWAASVGGELAGARGECQSLTSQLATLGEELARAVGAKEEGEATLTREREAMAGKWEEAMREQQEKWEALGAELAAARQACAAAEARVGALEAEVGEVRAWAEGVKVEAASTLASTVVEEKAKAFEEGRAACTASFNELLESGAYFPATEVEGRVASRVAALELATGSLAAESQRRLAEEAIQAAVTKVKHEYAARLAKVEGEKAEVIERLKKMSSEGKAIKSTLAESSTHSGALQAEKEGLEARVVQLEASLKEALEGLARKGEAMEAMEGRMREAWEAEGVRRDGEAATLAAQVDEAGSQARAYYAQLTECMGRVESLQGEVASLLSLLEAANASHASAQHQLEVQERVFQQQLHQQQQHHQQQLQQRSRAPSDSQPGAGTGAGGAVGASSSASTHSTPPHPGHPPVHPHVQPTPPVTTATTATATTNASALEVSLAGLGDDQRKMLEEQEASWVSAVAAIPTGNLERLNSLYTEWVNYCSESLLDTEGLPAMVGLVTAEATPEESKRSVHLWRADSLEILAKELGRLTALLSEHAVITTGRSPGAQSSAAQQFKELWTALVDGLREDIKGWFGPPSDELPTPALDQPIEFPVAGEHPQQQPQQPQQPQQQVGETPLDATLPHSGSSGLPRGQTPIKAAPTAQYGETPSRGGYKGGSHVPMLSPRRTLPKSLASSPSGKAHSGSKNEEAFPISSKASGAGTSRTSPITQEQFKAQSAREVVGGEGEGGADAAGDANVLEGEGVGAAAAVSSASAVPPPSSFTAISSESSSGQSTAASATSTGATEAGSDAPSTINPSSSSSSSQAAPPSTATLSPSPPSVVDTEATLLQEYLSLLRDKHAGLAVITEDYNKSRGVWEATLDEAGVSMLGKFEEHCKQQWENVEARSEDAARELVGRMARVYGYEELEGETAGKLRAWMHESAVALSAEAASEGGSGESASAAAAAATVPSTVGAPSEERATAEGEGGGSQPPPPPPPPPPHQQQQPVAQSPPPEAALSHIAPSNNSTLHLPPTNLINVFNAEEEGGAHNNTSSSFMDNPHLQASPRRPLTPPPEEGDEGLHTSFSIPAAPAPSTVAPPPPTQRHSGDTPPIQSRAAYRKALEYQASSRFPSSQDDAAAWVHRKYSAWVAGEGANLPEDDMGVVESAASAAAATSSAAAQAARGRGRARTGSVVSGASYEGGGGSRRSSVGPGRRGSMDGLMHPAPAAPIPANSAAAAPAAVAAAAPPTDAASEPPPPIRVPTMFFSNPSSTPAATPSLVLPPTLNTNLMGGNSSSCGGGSQPSATGPITPMLTRAPSFTGGRGSVGQISRYAVPSTTALLEEAAKKKEEEEAEKRKASLWGRTVGMFQWKGGKKEDGMGDQPNTLLPPDPNMVAPLRPTSNNYGPGGGMQAFAAPPAAPAPALAPAPPSNHGMGAFGGQPSMQQQNQQQQQVQAQAQQPRKAWDGSEGEWGTLSPQAQEAIKSAWLDNFASLAQM